MHETSIWGAHILIMKFLVTLTFLSALVSTFAAPAVTPTESPFVGSIAQPVAAEILPANDVFTFHYNTNNWCEQDYTQFKVFLTSGENPPTFSDVDTNADIEDALVSFGEFTIPNFPGIPTFGTPPPSSLTLPDLTGLVNRDEQLYITVVDIYESCPGHVVEEIGVTSVPVVYGA